MPKSHVQAGSIGLTILTGSERDIVIKEDHECSLLYKTQIES